MFARVVDVKTKPGKAKELCHTIHEKVITILRAYPGFVDEVVLINDAKADHVLAISFWKSKRDAEKYAQESYAHVTELIKHTVHSKPTVHICSVETSTAHKIAKGKAA